MLYIKESNEFFQSKLRPLNKVEENYIHKFIEAMKLTFEFSNFKKNRSKITEEHLDKFLKDIEPYLKYNFSSRLRKFKSDVDNHKIKLNNILAGNEEVDNYLKQHDEILNALKDGKLDKALKLNTPSRLQFAQDLSTKREGIVTFSNSNFYNPFSFESNFLFHNKDNLIHNFNQNDIDALEKHFKDNRMTDYKKSLSEIADPNALIYAIQNLKNKNVVRVDKNVDDWLRFNLQNDEKYKKALQLTNQFLHSNDKKLLQEIVKLINQIPLLRKANENLKKKIKKVYRGIAIYSNHDEDSNDKMNIKDIIEKDKKEYFVSTSMSEYAAKNFALAKGHLESDDSRRSEEGVILEYTTSPDSIYLCVEIFGSVFGEREVLIDPKKAKVTDTKFI